MKFYVFSSLIILILFSVAVSSIKINQVDQQQPVSVKDISAIENEYIEDESFKSMVDYLNQLPFDQMEEFCNGLGKSMFSAFKCTTREEIQSKKNLIKEIKSDMERLNLHNTGPKKPLILVPGVAGSGLEAKFNKTRSPAWYCKKNVDWHRIWLSVAQIAVQECWFDNLAVFYDSKTGDYANQEGVELQTIEFGGIKGVSYLDYIYNMPITLTNVYGDLIKFFTEIGYVPGKNIRGAPYDWRVSIKYLEKQGWMKDLKALIEDTYEQNGKQKVVLLSHSMGGMVSLYFLNTVTTSWKEKYIDSFIPIAAPWSGSPKALRTVISGNNLGIPMVSSSRVQNFAEQAGGIIQLLPDPLVWSKDTVFVSTPYKNFTIAQTPTLLNAIGLPTTAKIYDGIASVISGMKPNVETHCLYGYGVPTEIFYKYNKGFDEKPIIYETDMGDGTVPLDSLRLCESWKGHNGNHALEVKKFKLHDHLEVLSSDEVLKHIYQIVTKH